MALKWPNDLLLGNAKAGGILIELTGDALGPAYAVIGIGLNILAPAVDVAQVATGLRDHGLRLTRNDVLARLLERLEQGWKSFRAMASTASAPVGKRAMSGRASRSIC